MYSSQTAVTNNINELQSDVLGEKLTNNPLMKASSMVAKNKALKTTQKTVINAINELQIIVSNFTETASKDLSTMYSVVGNFAKDSSLKSEITDRGADTIIALLANTYDSQIRISEKLNALSEKISQLEQYAFDDYEDIFHIPESETRSEFKLTYKPIGKIRIYIDGIRYFSDTISYDENTNTVTWINTAEKVEGFNITDADVVFEYDYDRHETMSNR